MLERGEVANSWRTERWDSLRLLTPNWQSRLPGHRYDGPDPDGYMSMGEVIEFVESFAKVTGAPVLTEANVTSLRSSHNGYHLISSRGEIHCQAVIIASGACNKPAVPAFANAVPASVQQLTPFDYRNPDQLPEGGVSRRWSVRHRCAAGRGTAALGAPRDPLSRRTREVAPDLPRA